MSRALLVGDVHSVKSELDDCQKLVDLIVETIESRDPIDTVLFLGDQYHHFGIIHSDCLAFWREAFERIKMALRKRPAFLWGSQDCLPEQKRIVALVGNHDQPGVDSSDVHAMRAHESDITVISIARPIHIDGVLCIPYILDPEQFVEICRQYEKETSTVICHQAFCGSQYEGGYYAPDGIDPGQISQQIISGHVHKPQEFANVWHPGSPRWRTAADANSERFIHVVEFNRSGQQTLRESIATGYHCRPIIHITDSPDSPADLSMVGQADVRLDLQGPSEWIRERQRELDSMDKRIKVRTFSMDAPKRSTIKESEGPVVALEKYIQTFSAPHNTPIADLRSMVRERIEQ